MYWNSYPALKITVAVLIYVVARFEPPPLSAEPPKFEAVGTSQAVFASFATSGNVQIIIQASPASFGT